MPSARPHVTIRAGVERYKPPLAGSPRLRSGEGSVRDRSPGAWAGQRQGQAPPSRPPRPPVDLLRPSPWAPICICRGVRAVRLVTAAGVQSDEKAKSLEAVLEQRRRLKKVLRTRRLEPAPPPRRDPGAPGMPGAARGGAPHLPVAARARSPPRCGCQRLRRTARRARGRRNSHPATRGAERRRCRQAEAPCRAPGPGSAPGAPTPAGLLAPAPLRCARRAHRSRNARRAQAGGGSGGSGAGERVGWPSDQDADLWEGRRPAAARAAAAGAAPPSREAPRSLEDRLALQVRPARVRYHDRGSSLLEPWLRVRQPQACSARAPPRRGLTASGTRHRWRRCAAPRHATMHSLRAR